MNTVARALQVTGLTSSATTFYGLSVATYFLDPISTAIAIQAPRTVAAGRKQANEPDPTGLRVYALHMHACF